MGRGSGLLVSPGEHRAVCAGRASRRRVLIAATLALLLMSSMVAHGRERRKRLVAEALPNPTTEQARRTLLRPLIEAAVTRGEHMATLTDVNPPGLCAVREMGNRELRRLNDALGPQRPMALPKPERFPTPDQGSPGCKTKSLRALHGFGLFSTGWIPCRSWETGTVASWPGDAAVTPDEVTRT